MTSMHTNKESIGGGELHPPLTDPYVTVSRQPALGEYIHQR